MRSQIQEPNRTNKLDILNITLAATKSSRWKNENTAEIPIILANPLNLFHIQSLSLTTAHKRCIFSTL